MFDIDEKKLILEMRSRGWTAQTIKQYLFNISKFVNSQKDPKSYLFEILEKNKSESYYKSIYASLKFLYYVYGKKNEFDAKKIKCPKKSKKLPEVLSQKEITNMIELTMNNKHKLILMTLYSAGLRVSELVNLRWNNILFDRNLIIVKQGKGKKDRTTLLSKTLKRNLKKYVKFSKSEYIFLFH